MLSLDQSTERRTNIPPTDITSDKRLGYKVERVFPIRVRTQARPTASTEDGEPSVSVQHSRFKLLIVTLILN